MRHAVTVTNRQSAVRCPRAVLVRAARAALRAERAGPARIDLAVVSDAEIARLNRRFLNHRGPTDVISFDLSDPGDPTRVGQLVVSADCAERQAARRGHSTAAELALYVVHGVLHLLGYDDRRAADRERMAARQRELLAGLGVKLCD